MEGQKKRWPKAYRVVALPKLESHAKTRDALCHDASIIKLPSRQQADQDFSHRSPRRLAGLPVKYRSSHTSPWPAFSRRSHASSTALTSPSPLSAPRTLPTAIESQLAHTMPLITHHWTMRDAIGKCCPRSVTQERAGFAIPE